MKKIIGLILIILLLFTLASCNYQVVDLNWHYNRAIIRLQDGTIIDGKIESWKDYEGEQLQIKINGVTYLVNTYNATLISE